MTQLIDATTLKVFREMPETARQSAASGKWDEIMSERVWFHLPPSLNDAEFFRAAWNVQIKVSELCAGIHRNA